MAERDSVSAEVERTLRTIFGRCLQCDPNVVLTCPNCPSGQICSSVTQTCDSCPYRTCIADPSASPASSGSSTGAIVGGAVGGLVVLAAVLFLFWLIRSRQRRAAQLEAEALEEDFLAKQRGHPVIKRDPADAASIRTRASHAGSFLSRASHYIPIAFFPGVTNRDGSSLHSLAPVPPIPARHAQGPPKSPLSAETDLFFRPGSFASSKTGVRDTQYTAWSGRQSITPSLARSSMASEVYRDDATMEPMPATTVLRAAPRMVSVRSSPAGTPESESPPTMASNGGVKVMMPGQGFAPAGTPPGISGKATQVTVPRPGSRGSGSRPKGRFPVRTGSDDSTPRGVSMVSSSGGRRTPTVSSPLIESTIDSDDDDGNDDEHARARQSLIRPQTADTGSPSSPSTRQPLQSPFFDASELMPTSISVAPLNIPTSRPNPYAAMSSAVKSSNPGTSPKRGGARPFGGLGAVIEEATKKAASTEGSVASSTVGAARGPFGDEHMTD